MLYNHTFIICEIYENYNRNHKIIKICGNAALAGAVRILHDRRMEKEATALAERAKTINLGSSAKFQEFYMEYMMFDE